MTESAPQAPASDADGRIFVGIPVLNRVDLLEKSLKSIDRPARILIINNNNVDRDFNHRLHELSGDDTRIQVLDQPRNLGVAASWNLILQTAFAEGLEWAFIASNDVALAPGSLDAAERFIGQTNSGVCHLCAWNFFALSRVAMERVGWFDENYYPAYKEDQDYVHRCELAAVPRGDVEGASGEHRCSSTIHSDGNYLRRNDETHAENREYYISKWGGDSGEELYRHPFNDARNDVRWWPSVRDSFHDRDWDREREAIRERRPTMTITEIYDRARTTPSDISEHLGVLHKYASSVRHITEFGTRTGNSTAAFLMAAPERLISYDAARQPEIDALEAAARHQGIHFRFLRRNIRHLGDIEPSDLLFLDSVHTYEQVAFELRFAERIRDFIVLHDTETFGTIGEDGGEGIWRAVSEFLRSRAEWRLHAHYTHNNGLTILQRAGNRDRI